MYFGDTFCRLIREAIKRGTIIHGGIKARNKALQGLSVLAMVCLHLFCRYTYTYHPVIYIRNLPLCFYLGQMGDFCVMGFAFCSGYAHYIKCEIDGSNYYRNGLHGLFRVMTNYWLIVIIVAFVKHYFIQEPFSLWELLKNLLFIENPFNGTWWYMTTYILIVLSSPVVIGLIKRYPLKTAMVFVVLYLISYILRFKYVFDNWFIRQFYLYGMTVAEYAIGIYICKYKILGKIRKWINKFQSTLLKAILGIGFALFSVARCTFFPSLLIAPICGINIIVLFHIYYEENVFFDGLVFVGNHSTNIWLTHFFFIGTLFPELVFSAKYPILTFAFTVGLSLCLPIALKVPLGYLFDGNKKK